MAHPAPGNQPPKIGSVQPTILVVVPTLFVMFAENVGVMNVPLVWKELLVIVYTTGELLPNVILISLAPLPLRCNSAFM